MGPTRRRGRAARGGFRRASGEPFKGAGLIGGDEPPRLGRSPGWSGQLPSRDESSLVPHNTFDSFVVGNGNQFAHAVCLAVAQSPGERYNPFLYGGVGLGKTHLMHAIGHFVRAQRLHAKIFFVSAEKFMNEMIYAIQHATTLEFKARTARPTCSSSTTSSSSRARSRRRRSSSTRSTPSTTRTARSSSRATGRRIR